MHLGYYSSCRWGIYINGKKIIITNFTILILALLTIAVAPGIHLILAASLLTGICSVIPQIFIPIASQFSLPKNKGCNIGVVGTGITLTVGSLLITIFTKK